MSAPVLVSIPGVELESDPPSIAQPPSAATTLVVPQRIGFCSTLILCSPESECLIGATVPRASSKERLLGFDVGEPAPLGGRTMFDVLLRSLPPVSRRRKNSRPPNRRSNLSDGYMGRSRGSQLSVQRGATVRRWLRSGHGLSIHRNKSLSTRGLAPSM
jgi:hypothetical protein